MTPVLIINGSQKPVDTNFIFTEGDYNDFVNGRIKVHIHYVQNGRSAFIELDTNPPFEMYPINNLDRLQQQLGDETPQWYSFRLK
jgi:hypothetical protein